MKNQRFFTRRFVSVRCLSQSRLCAESSAEMRIYMGINNLDSELDWEYMSDFYQEGERKVRSFEEISKETAEDRELQARCAEIDVTTLEDKLAKTILDVKRVKKESLKGGTIEEIAISLGMSKEYVTTILMNVQGYAEDNDVAIAHLVLME